MDDNVGLVGYSVIVRLSTEAVIALNQEFCGAGALLSWSDIDSAANQPYQSAFGDDAYVTIFDKAAVLLAGVAKAHCLSMATNVRAGRRLRCSLTSTVSICATTFNLTGRVSSLSMSSSTN